MRAGILARRFLYLLARFFYARDIDKDVKIGEGTMIGPCVRLEGSTVIGKNCKIEQNCRIVDSTIGDGVSIDSSVILDSSVGSETSVGPFAYIRPGSAIGEGCKVGDFVLPGLI